MEKSFKEEFIFHNNERRSKKGKYIYEIDSLVQLKKPMKFSDIADLINSELQGGVRIVQSWGGESKEPANSFLLFENKHTLDGYDRGNAEIYGSIIKKIECYCSKFNKNPINFYAILVGGKIENETKLKKFFPDRNELHGWNLLFGILEVQEDKVYRRFSPLTNFNPAVVVNVMNQNNLQIQELRINLEAVEKKREEMESIIREEMESIVETEKKKREEMESKLNTILAKLSEEKK